MQVKRARQYVVYGKFNKRDIFSLAVECRKMVCLKLILHESFFLYVYFFAAVLLENTMRSMTPTLQITIQFWTAFDVTQERYLHRPCSHAFLCFVNRFYNK